MNRETLIADEGMIYTDGETYGSVIHLAKGVSRDAFYQITVEEYEALTKADVPMEPAYD